MSELISDLSEKRTAEEKMAASQILQKATAKQVYGLPVSHRPV